MIARIIFAVSASVIVLPVSAPAQLVTPQRQFDEASRAFEASSWQAAADGFAKFQQMTKATTGKAVAIAQIREGHARLKLGQERPAIYLLESGLAQAPGDASHKADRLLALQDLAATNEANNEVELAAVTFARVAAIADDSGTKLAALAGVARNAMFADPEESIDAGQRILALAAGSSVEATRARAVALNMIGRAHLIAGRNSEASASLQRALTEAGGMTKEIDLLDASIRADLGMAALLSNDHVSAHKYLAASGVVRASNGFLPIPKFTDALSCSDTNTPNEVAVFEFGIDRSGTPVHVRPVFASQGNQNLEQMGNYVRLYLRFDSTAVARLHPLRAATARLELHCAATELNESGLIQAVEPLNDWLKARGVQTLEARAISGQAALDRARRDLVEKELQAGKTSVALLPALGVIAGSELTNLNETMVARRRQLDILRAANAPAWVVASIEVRYAMIKVDSEVVAYRKIAALAGDAVFRRDPEARLYLNYTKALYASSPDQIARELRMVAMASELAADHPLRRAASAKLFYYDRAPDVRRGHLRRAGLSANPCRAARVTKISTPSGKLYPQEAARWGFEGWLVAEKDLDAAGRVTAFRPMMSYPPFVFNAAASREAMSSRFKVTNAIVPNAGCTATYSVIKFQFTE